MQLQLHYATYTTPQLLQQHYATLHPAIVREVTDQMTTATIVAAPENTAQTTFQSMRGSALPSVIHSNQALLQGSFTLYWNFRHCLVRHYW